MKRVILIHGNGGSNGTDNWFPYVKEHLEKIGVTCVTPDMPDPILARSKYWLPYLEDVLKAGENTILIGHSSGAPAIMRYTDLGYDDEKESGYFDKPWDWDAIRKNQNWVVIFASATDPYIPIEDPQFIRDQLDAEYYELENEGHFGGTGERVKLEFPEMVDVIKEKLGL